MAHAFLRVCRGEMLHVPVLLDAIVREIPFKKGIKVLDATFGAGGYTRRLLGIISDKWMQD